MRHDRHGDGERGEGWGSQERRETTRTQLAGPELIDGHEATRGEWNMLKDSRGTMEPGRPGSSSIWWCREGVERLAEETVERHLKGRCAVRSNPLQRYEQTRSTSRTSEDMLLRVQYVSRTCNSIAW
jgi:hypothetical protein